VHELVPNLRTGLRDGISFDRRMKRFRYPHSLDKQIAPVILAIALPPFTLWVFYETLFEGGFPNRNGPRAPLPLSIFFVYGICIMAAVGLSLGGRAMLAYVEISEDAITQRSWWGAVRTIRLSDITSYGPGNDDGLYAAYVISSSAGARIVVEKGIDEYSEFVSLFEEKMKSIQMAQA